MTRRGWFLPGSATLVVTDRAVGFVNEPFDGELAVLVSQRMLVDMGSPFDAVIRLPPESMPDFAMVEVDGDDLRVLARGDVTVIVQDHSVRLRPGNVRTWSEQVINGAADSTVVVVFGNAATDDDRPFVAENARVPASAVEWTMDPVGVRFDQPNADARTGDQTETADFNAGELTIDPDVPAVSWMDVAAGRSFLGEQAEPKPLEPERAKPEPTLSEEGFTMFEPPEEPAPPVSDPMDSGGGAAHDVPPPLIPPGPDIAASSWATPRVAVISDGEPLTDSDGDDYDHLFGTTVARSVEGAAMRPGEPSSARGVIASIPTAGPSTSSSQGPAPLPWPGDHDGRTISRAQLRAMQQAPAEPGELRHGPQVQAAVCPLQHANPPYRNQCRVCAAPLSGEIQIVTRPALGTLRFSTGESVALDRQILIGRAPKVDGEFSGDLPHLVALAGSEDVSRTHVEVRVIDWQVSVVDRHSVNGTVVTLPGSNPQRIRPGESLAISPGTVLSFADEVTAVFEEATE